MTTRPKRPLSSYMQWFITCGRQHMKKQYPNFKVTQIAKKCGEEWANMKEADKLVWQSRATLAMKKYKQHMKDLKAQQSSIVKSDCTHLGSPKRETKNELRSTRSRLTQSRSMPDSADTNHRYNGLYN